MITSTGSSQVKHVVSLQKKSKTRKECQEFVVEGMKLTAEAPKERVVKVYASESFLRNNGDFLENFDADKVETVSDHVFLQMSDTKTPQGVLAVVRMRNYQLSDMLKTVPLLLIVENLQDPGNLGTLLRMGEGAGITGVVMSSGTVDMYNPKTIRSTMGSVYRVPFMYAENFEGILTELKDNKVTLYAAHLDGKCDYTAGCYTKPAAFLIGNEANGITDKTAKSADVLVRIPMAGQVESFNAAIAGTILTFEAVRQRRNS